MGQPDDETDGRPEDDGTNMALPAWQGRFAATEAGSATEQWAATGELGDVLHLLRCCAHGGRGTASSGEQAARKLCILLMQMMPHLERVDDRIRSGLALLLQANGDWERRGEVMTLIIEKGGLEA